VVDSSLSGIFLENLRRAWFVWSPLGPFVEHGMTKLKLITRISVAALSVAAFGVGAHAQLSVAIKTAERSTAAGAAAQARIDRIDDQVGDVVREYRAALQEKETVALNVDQQSIFLKSQKNEIDSLRGQIDRVGEIQAQLLPMMLRMIGSLEAFVGSDVPFQMEERENRIVKLKELASDANQSPAELYRQIINAYQIELSYGNQTTSYNENVLINGEPRKVEFLRIGRVALIYTDSEGKMHIFNKATGSYDPLPDSYKLDVQSATRIALEQKTPEVFPAPLPGATKVQ
jgi:Protein of unknown function (DUF3450)